MCYVILFCFVNYSCIGQERREMLTTQKLNNFVDFMGYVGYSERPSPLAKISLLVHISTVTIR